MRKDPCVLVFRTSFSEKDRSELGSLFRHGRGLGWHVIEVEYSTAAERHLQLEIGKPSVEVKSLVRFWNPSGCIVECAGRPPTLPLDDFGEVPIVLLDCDPSEVRGRSVCVYNDSDAVAAAAAGELLSLGFKDYAFVPFPADVSWNRERGEMFARLVRMNGKHLHAGPPKVSLLDMNEANTVFAEWLERLPRPCGVFAANDVVASFIVKVCAMKSIAIPDDIAVLGADNEEHVCENLPVSLSSIKMDVERAGVLAVDLLARRIASPGEWPDSEKFGVMGVCRRASTRLLRLADARVVKALEYIRRHVCERITPPDVVAGMGCSRRFADMLFMSAVGQTVFEVIRQTRIERVKDMLTASTRSVASVSDMCGYRSLPALCREFKTVTGLSISEWRKDQ